VSTAPRYAPATVSRPEISRVRQSTRRDLTPPPTRSRSASELEVLFLSEIVAAHAEVRAAIDAAFSSLSPRGPDLVTLRSDLRRRLDQLLEALLAISEEGDAIDALVPFVFFVDEQVEHALVRATEPGGESWLQLQRDLFPERNAEGGDAFYERAEALLGEGTPRVTVIAAYLFCLKVGFRGRLADESEDAVERWITALAERLPSSSRRYGVSTPAWRAPRRKRTYLFAALGAIAGWHFLVSLWAYLQ
jgi:type VI protein secretion system component VasF